METIFFMLVSIIAFLTLSGQEMLSDPTVINIFVLVGAVSFILFVILFADLIFNGSYVMRRCLADVGRNDDDCFKFVKDKYTSLLSSLFVLSMSAIMAQKNEVFGILAISISPFALFHFLIVLMMMFGLVKRPT
jgi:hypothetical protein